MALKTFKMLPSMWRSAHRRLTSPLAAWHARFNSTMTTRVQINQGELEGSLESTSNGVNFSSFKGIPYAEPPGRFAAATPPLKWIGVRNAKKHRSVCPQWDMTTTEILDGSEDCLFLNVYSPNTSSEKAAPVMVWFHGGGFQSGSGDSSLYGPDYIIEEGVVLVTINYRLEVLGYLSLQSEEAPGNAGMKDQVMALRWVQENISEFGGDPNNVTIFGESAGGASATYHLVSPMSKGLFHKVISQSGCFFNEWTLDTDCVARAFRLGKYLGKETDDPDEMVWFLRSVNDKKLIKITYPISTEAEKYRGLPIFFVPVLEKIFKGQECFLPKLPLDCLRAGEFADVPILAGYNDSEGIVFIKQGLKTAALVQKEPDRKIPRDIAAVASPELAKKLGEQMIKFYFGDRQIGEETMSEIAAIEGDYVFSYGVQKFAKTMAKVSKSPIYLYRFSADSKLNFMKTMTGYTQVKGACHGDDLFHLFKTFLEVKEGSKELSAIKRMVRMWTNFAKFGNPTPDNDSLIPVKWKPVTPQETNFLDIGLELNPGMNPDKERYELWESLYGQVQDKLKSNL